MDLPIMFFAGRGPLIKQYHTFDISIVMDVAIHKIPSVSRASKLTTHVNHSCYSYYHPSQKLNSQVPSAEHNRNSKKRRYFLTHYVEIKYSLIATMTADLLKES